MNEDEANAINQVAFKRWQRIISLWPIDRVRPERVSFQYVMQKRLQKLHPNIQPEPASPSTSPSTPVIANETLVSPANPKAPVQNPGWKESYEIRQTNALNSLLENRYADESPMPPMLRHPTFNPEYYDQVAKEMRDAPDRSWFQGFMLRIKETFRLT